MEQSIANRALELLRLAGVCALDAGQERLLGEFLAEVERWGARIHLVGKRNLPGTVSTLVLDSFLLHAAALRSGAFAAQAAGIRVADIGSGAGFPGIIWKIAAPGHRVTLFERREKQQVFLDRVTAILSIDGLRVDGRDAAAAAAEEPFDAVLSKASGRLPELLPLAARLLRDEGAYCTTKGRGWMEELEGADAGEMKLDRVEDLPFDRGFALIFRKFSRKE